MIKLKYKTLCEAFLNIHSDVVHRFIDNTIENSISPVDFENRVKKILSFLIKSGVNKGDEVIFQINSNTVFVQVFWACILGGIIPVPYAYLDNDKDRSKLVNIWHGLKNPFLITDYTTMESFKNVIEHKKVDGFKAIEEKILILENVGELTEEVQFYLPDENDIAFIQYSSGSTSDPKGVMITHKNIISSINNTLKAMNVTANDIYLSWLPLTHSFGLIGTYLTPVLAGVKFYLMPSDVFVKNPVLWIEKLSEHSATITASPNFGLKLVCKFIKYKRNLKIDLSALRIIIDGAEPVSAEVCYEFIERMSVYGMKDTVVQPSYGLSEATLVVSTPREQTGVTEVKVLREKVRVGEKIEEILDNRNAMTLVEVGAFLEGFEIQILDDNYNPVEDRVVGSVCLKGDMIFSGYYNNTEATKDVLDEDGWFNTGDLGFLRDGNLVLTGRVKDVFFINGENYYSHDIESICRQIENEKFSKVAICSSYNEKRGQEQLICFVEYKHEKEGFKEIENKIRQHVLEKIGIGITYVIPVNEMPTTVSGKIKRYILVKKFKRGDYNGLYN